MTKELATLIMMVAGTIMAFIGLSTSKGKISFWTWVGIVLFEAISTTVYYVTTLY